MERKNGEWTIKETKKVFSNDFFQVFEDQIVQPDGKNGSYATIEFKRGSAVLPVDDENNIYITKQFRYAIERENFEAAAGTIEDENHLEAAKREAVEELGIEAEKWTDFGTIVENTSVTKTANKIYLAQKLIFTEQKPEGTEKIKVIKMPLKEALDKVMRGEISHDLTCILILKAYIYLNQTK